MHPGFTPLILVLPDEQKEESLKREGVDTCFDFFVTKDILVAILMKWQTD